jgi:hypothetical protein
MAATKKEMMAKYKRQWLAFPNAPGTRLSWRRVKWRTWELAPESGSAWATLRLEGGSFVGPERCVITVKDQKFEMQGGTWGVRTTDQSDRHLVSSTGTSVLQRSGVHFGRSAGTSVRLSHQGVYTFPVTGHFNTGLMSAVDRAGNTLIRYRLHVVRPAQAVIGFGYGRMKVEMMVSPEALSIQNIELLAAATSELLPAYFQSDSSGG